MKSHLSGTDTIWTISALNFEVKTMLSEGIGSLWIEGEVSNFACPASGHWYFTLKDERAQCRAAMFKGRNNRVGFLPKNGQHVLVRARVTLYEARGEYQLVVEHLEDAGIGELMRRYEALKAKLGAEGLFANELKRPLPSQPKSIAIVTSPTGAAIRDVLSVLGRRAPHIPVLVFPTMVQGEQAAGQILQALKRVRQHGGCDVLLLVRGGGSLEDMWCFNDEALAREIADFPIPVVTGIGHEIDFTIADFVADLRAPTPSVAAETISPDRYEIMQTIDTHLSRITNQALQQLARAEEKLAQISRRLGLQHPQRAFAQLKIRLNYAYETLLDRNRNRINSDKHRLRLCQSIILQSSPLLLIRRQKEALAVINSNNVNAIRQRILAARHDLALQARSLDALSPLKTLSRGFAKITKDQKLVSSISQLSKGDEIEITLSDGSKAATVQ
ncbi:MAG: exodeoxyribonuclease VII large subunit [Gammaproteobacteria bacterium]|nr:exodeoxyribonuclease VII large subunit [Gammaproteobacteria bacterium]MCZ6797351.1 exodeoxyribonuclease VII large subunit [Gammaproteobacteria bacterium]